MQAGEEDVTAATIRRFIGAERLQGQKDGWLTRYPSPQNEFKAAQKTKHRVGGRWARPLEKASPFCWKTRSMQTSDQREATPSFCCENHDHDSFKCDKSTTGQRNTQMKADKGMWEGERRPEKKETLTRDRYRCGRHFIVVLGCLPCKSGIQEDGESRIR